MRRSAELTGGQLSRHCSATNTLEIAKAATRPEVIIAVATAHGKLC
jgi:hypothetical protein